jgi:hypothetical protein
MGFILYDIQNYAVNNMVNQILWVLLFFGVLHLMLPETPQPYGLLYYPRIGLSNFLHQFRAAPPPKQRKLEL